jgi:O-antigen/teichoic acid export membrane protein
VSADRPAPRASASVALGRRLVLYTLHTASGRVFGILVWMVITPAILGALGTVAFAVWSLFFAFTGYLSALDFGLVLGTVRHVAAARGRGEPEESGRYATLGVLGFLVLAVAWFALTLLLREHALGWLRVPPASADDARSAMLLAPLVFALAGCASVTSAVAQGCGRFDIANLVMVVASAEQLVGVFVVLRAGWGLQGLLLNVGVGWALSALAGVALLARAVPDFRWRSPRASLGRLREVFAFGGVVQITNLLSGIHQQLDKFLLARFVALAATTTYELGARVALSASSVPGLLLVGVLPTAAHIHAAHDLDRLHRLYERANRYVLLAAAALLAASLGAADRLYLAWLGPGHEASAFTLQMLMIGIVASLSTGIGTSLTRGIGRPELEARFAAVVLTLHAALSLWLVPRIGYRGALVAWIASNVIGAISFLWSMARAMHWSVPGVLLRPHAVPALAAALASAAVWGMGRVLPGAGGALGWLIVVLLGGAAAAVVWFTALATRYVDWREARALLAPES